MTAPFRAPCVFCEIIAGREPADVWHEDERLIVFRNRLRWLPVMLLIVPRQHKTQEQFWREDMEEAAALAVEIGKKHTPGGFRLLSNFGHDALQTVAHGHLHLLGGTPMGVYV